MAQIKDKPPMVAAAAAATSNALAGVEGAVEGIPEEPSLRDLCFDPEDGMLDLSAWLATAKGFLPTGGFITEPAVGNGGYLGLMFLHDSIQNRAELAKDRHPNGTLKRMPPPSVTGLFGFGTENGSWGGGLLHMHVFKDDQMRYLGGLFYNEMNLDYYGRGGDLPAGLDSISYTLDGYLLLQQMMFRVADSDVFLGANYKYMSFDTKLDLGLGITPPDWFPSLERTLTSAGVGLIAEYDTRNSIFTPDSGINAKFMNTFYDHAFGSDQEFNKLLANLRGWIPLRRNWVLGLRGDAAFSGGDIPFYMLPGVDLRGISLSRYQGQHTLTTEAELRWDFTDRWSLLGFCGVGWVAENDLDDYDFSDGHVAGGTGFRYLIAKTFGIRTGMDFAWSEDDFAFYFTTGTAWGQK
ncbi:MAG: BamA/TamA family outer membrane protein [Verrucomicrobia bacterium]|nr:BamA/TamA family outer membrane protein [Verrucomicrobiota bacterium]